MSLPALEINQKRKTALKTFRFSRELLCLLENESEREGTSLNALAGTIIARHLEWETKARRFGFVPVYKPIFRTLIEALDNETLSEIGRKSLPTLWQEMAEFWFQDSSPDKILDLWSLESRHIPYVQTEVKKQGNEYTIVTHHELGPKYNIVIRSGLDELVRKVFLAQPTISVGDTIVTAAFSVLPGSSPT